jgi:uncharacterized Zn-binding protein involved in type VI secretion
MKLVRVGDLCEGECRAGHPDVQIGLPKKFVAVYISGAGSVFINGTPQAIVGSLGETDCGHTITAIGGSDSVFAENQPIYRIGDLGAINEGEGECVAISGSDNVGDH